MATFLRAAGFAVVLSLSPAASEADGSRLRAIFLWVSGFIGRTDVPYCDETARRRSEYAELDAKLQEARRIAEVARQQVANDRSAAVEAYRLKAEEMIQELRRSRSAAAAQAADRKWKKLYGDMRLYMDSLSGGRAEKAIRDDQAEVERAAADAREALDKYWKGCKRPTYGGGLRG